MYYKKFTILCVVIIPVEFVHLSKYSWKFYKSCDATETLKSLMNDISNRGEKQPIYLI